MLICAPLGTYLLPDKAYQLAVVEKETVEP